MLKKSGWLQKLALDKAEIAKKQNLWDFDLLNKHPEKVTSANEHFDVNINLEEFTSLFGY